MYPDPLNYYSEEEWMLDREDILGQYPSYEDDYLRMQGDPVDDWYWANYKPTISDRLWSLQQWLKELPRKLYWKAYDLKCRVKVALYGEVEVPF